MHRPLLPAVLLLVAVSATTIAARQGPAAVEEGDKAAVVAVPTPVTPVLSPRRVPGIVVAPVARARLQGALEALWSDGPDSACLMVSDGSELLYERQPDLPLIPASTAKLVTAAAVLHHMDPEERLTTKVIGPEPDDGIVDGDLWLVGGGDPVLGTQDWAAHFERQPLVTPLEELARVMADEAGIREVRGRLIGDDSRYDSTRHVPSWPERYRVDSETGPLGALWVNDALSAWEPDPVSVADPAQAAAATLSELLRRRGVVIAGEAGSGRAPSGVEPLAVLESPPVGDLVGQMLRESDNGTAELLLKEIGLRARGLGATGAGAAAAMAGLADRGLPTAGLQVMDGSGLDRGNRVTCRLLMALLEQSPPGGPIDSGLAVAGVSGTLAERHLDTPAQGRLRAKTGSLLQVAALSGSAEARDGASLTFAYVVNGMGTFADGVELQDRLVDLLVRYPDVPALDDLGPLPAA